MPDKIHNQIQQYIEKHTIQPTVINYYQRRKNSNPFQGHNFMRNSQGKNQPCKENNNRKTS